MNIKTCDFGCGNPSIKLFRSSGKYCCSIHSSSCPAMKVKNSNGVSKKRQELGNKFWVNGHPKGMKNKSPYNKGKTYEEVYGEEKAKELKNMCRQSAIKNIAGKLHTESTKSKLSEIALSRHANGWDNKAGRCKKYKYYSPIAGHVTLDGTWELKTAVWLDKNNYNWKRTKTRFEYVISSGQVRYYTPDFWIEQFDSYLEVKGHETELDRCKWSQFKNKLIIWKKKELLENGVLP